LHFSGKRKLARENEYRKFGVGKKFCFSRYLFPSYAQFIHNKTIHIHTELFVLNILEKFSLYQSRIYTCSVQKEFWQKNCPNAGIIVWKKGLAAIAVDATQML
jgi:hypothetical protein